MPSNDDTDDIYNSTKLRFDKIPACFREQPNWVLWKYETTPTGRPTKPPYKPDGYLASSTNPETWSTFEEACQAYQSGGYEGIGWCLPDDGDYHYWGLDYDDAINPDTGTFRRWEHQEGFDVPAIQPIEAMDLNTYGEITPSLAGCRFFGRSLVPVPTHKDKTYGERNPNTGKDPGIEIYSTGRYFTFTGLQIPGTPDDVRECTDELLALHATVFPPTRPTIAATKSSAGVDVENAVDTLADLLVDGYTGSRNNLLYAMCGILLKQKWPHEDIVLLLKTLVALFNEKDPNVDAEVMMEKALKMLATGAQSVDSLPSYTYLGKLVAPEVLTAVRALLKEEPDSKTSAGKMHSDESIDRMLHEYSPTRVPRKEYEWLIERVIPKDTLLVFTGAAGDGKSTLVKHWCTEMARNGCDVLYLDRDNPINTVQEVFARLGGLPDNFIYWGNWVRDADGNLFEAPDPDSPILKRKIARMTNPILVFDTFSVFSKCDENNAKEVSAAFRVFRNLQSLGATVIVVHHTGKTPNGSGYRGSSAIPDSIDLGFEVVATKNEENLITRMRLKPFKTRIPAKELTFGMRDGVPFWEVESREDYLMDLLRRNPGLTKEDFTKVAMESNIHRNTARKFIEDGLMTKKVKRVGTKCFVNPAAPCVVPIDRPTALFEKEDGEDDPELFARLAVP